MNIIYSEDIKEPPEYLNVEVFEETIENALRNSGILLQNIEFSMGSKIGENYCSLIYRVHLKYRVNEASDDQQLKNLSVIIKSMPISTSNEFLNDLKVFIKEKTTYYEILPRMELFLKGNERFGAR